MLRLVGDEGAMLLALWHLRYLTGDQLHSWMSERSVRARKIRLSRFSKEGFLEVVRYGLEGRCFAWRLTRDGCDLLSGHWHRDHETYDQLDPKYLGHLIGTNEVFLTLARGEVLWSKVPFSWVGSHRALLRFKAADSQNGFPQRRDRLIHADAIITPRGTRKGPRVFLELDNRTESIRSTTGRTSIQGKLNAYQAFIFGRGYDRRTWYEATYPDRRPPLVLFVVTGSNKVQMRRRSILDAVKSLQAVDAPAVDCVPLTDQDEVRRAVSGIGCGKALSRWHMEQGAKVWLSEKDFDHLAAMYRWTAARAKKEDNDALASSVKRSREILKRVADKLAG